MRIIYDCLGWLLTPVSWLYVLWQGVGVRGWWRDVGERYGGGERLPPGCVWVHAASVGEVQVAAALVRALTVARPGLPVLLTTVTPTGRERARALLGDAVILRYLPFDFPWTVPRFLDRARPALGVCIETELWPTLYRECGRRGVPLVLASARVSAGSAARYRRFPGLFGAALAGDVAVAAQTAADAERFVAIGADPGRTQVVGNLKFDFEVPAETRARSAALRTWLGDRPVWVAGSTHPGEEDAVLAAHERVRRRHPAALLVLAPRRPERFAAVGAALRRAGVAHVARSSGAPVGPGEAVLLLDTLGDLLAFYGAGDVAFVGGSLVPVGGHNLLEPAALGKPVLTGPQTGNAVGVADLLVAAGAAHVVHGAEELAVRVADYLADPAVAQRDGERARAVLAANRGALGRVLALVEARLPPAPAGLTSPPPRP